MRGTDGASAADILARVNDENRYAFDQRCRVRAVEIAAALGMREKLSASTSCPTPSTSRADACARRWKRRTAPAFPIENIIFETTEDERIHDAGYLKKIFATYRREGFKTAIDDFGAGYAGLNLLADFQPDIVKLDMALIRNIDTDRARQTIVGAMAAVGTLLGIAIIAEGVEQPREAMVLHQLGISLMQGYLFARPGFEMLPQVDFDVITPMLERRAGAA